MISKIMNANHIKKVGRELVAYVAKHMGVREQAGAPYHDWKGYNYVELKTENYFLSFQEWSTGPYYLVVLEGKHPKFELNLERIIFDNNEYTWILSKMHKTYKKLLKEKYGEVKNKDKNLRGYQLCENVSYEELQKKFLELILYVINEDVVKQGKRVKYKLDSLEAYEGYALDRRILARGRNKKLADSRKRKDNYTCQACKQKIVINGKAVIECHHKDPLVTEVKTTIGDLVSLCPTCHRIAHLRKHPYSVKEIRKLRKKIKVVKK